MSPDADPTRKRSRGPRLAFLLVALAIVPMLGVGIVLVDRYREAELTQRLADRVDAGMTELRQLDDVRISLSDERNWALADTQMSILGIGDDLAEQFVGLRPREQVEISVVQVDRALAIGAGIEYRAAVDEARALGPGDPDAAQAAYVRIEERLADRIRDTTSQLVEAATPVPAGSQLLWAIDSLELASDARVSNLGQAWSFVGVQYAGFVEFEATDLDLVRFSDRASRSLEALERRAAPGSDIERAIDAIVRSPFIQDVADATDAVLVDDRGDTTERDLFETARTNADLFASTGQLDLLFDDLVGAAIDEVESAAGGLRDDASDQLERTILTLTVISLVAIAFAAAIGHYVGRPMVELAGAAQRLGQGGEVTIRHGGPAEVRRVADALQVAADGLAHVERLEHEATHDDLTGVPTRKPVQAHLEQVLARNVRTAERGAVMFVDVDHFKDINDTYGHAAGDAVLVAVADRLRGALRFGDVLGRFGGDEFVVIVESVLSTGQAVSFGERLAEAVRPPIDVSAVSDVSPSASASVSVGVTLFGDGHETIEEVLRRADRATYEAKATGRDRAVLATSPAETSTNAEVVATH